MESQSIKHMQIKMQELALGLPFFSGRASQIRTTYMEAHYRRVRHRHTMISTSPLTHYTHTQQPQPGLANSSLSFCVPKYTGSFTNWLKNNSFPCQNNSLSNDSTWPSSIHYYRHSNNVSGITRIR